MAKYDDHARGRILTRILLILYVSAFAVGAALVLWAILFLGLYRVGGSDDAIIPAPPLMPWLPIAALALLTFKVALLWSVRPKP